MAIIENIMAWLQCRPRLSPGSLSEFESDPLRFTRSAYIKSLINSPQFSEAVPSKPYDVLNISNPHKRTGFLFIKDLLRLERLIRWGSPGLYTAMGDDILRVTYREEFVRLVAELRGPIALKNLSSDGSATVAAVQQAANVVIDAARKARR